VDINLSATHLMRAEFDQGQSIAEEAERLSTQLAIGPVRPIALCWRGIAAGYRGDVATAERRFREAEAMAPDDPDVLAATDMLGRGVMALLAEDRAGALAAIERSRRRGQPLMSDPTSGIAVLLRSVDGKATRQEVEALLADSVRGSRWTDIWVVTAQAIATARDDATEGTRLVEANLESIRRYPVYGTLALRLVGEAALRDGWGHPELWLREAEERARSLQLDDVASAARTLLRRVGVHLPRPRAVDQGVSEQLRRAGITAREYEVFGLLVDLPTNAELAERLHLSVRTIEKHVASLLMKLGAESRRDLAAVGAEHAPTPRA